MRGSVLLVFSSKSFFLKSPVGCVSHLVAPQAPPSARRATFLYPFFKILHEIPQRQNAKLRSGPPARRPRRSSGLMVCEHSGEILRDKTHPYVRNKKKKKRREPPREKLRPSAGGMHALTSSASCSTPRLDATSPHTCWRKNVSVNTLTCHACIYPFGVAVWRLAENDLSKLGEGACSRFIGYTESYE